MGIECAGVRTMIVCVTTLKGNQKKKPGRGRGEGGTLSSHNVCMAVIFLSILQLRLLPTTCKHKAGCMAQGVMSPSQSSLEALDYFLENS